MRQLPQYSFFAALVSALFYQSWQAVTILLLVGMIYEMASRRAKASASLAFTVDAMAGQVSRLSVHATEVDRALKAVEELPKLVKTVSEISKVVNTTTLGQAFRPRSKE